MEETLYFAYGSNINLDQMAYRCPAAQVVGPVVLEGYELLFRGNASGNGVATIKPKEGQQYQFRTDGASLSRRPARWAGDAAEL